MLLPGWTRRVRGPVGGIVSISYEDPTSYQDVGGVSIATRFVAVTASGISLRLDQLDLSTGLETELFARMMQECWVDVAELRAHDRNARNEEEVRGRQRVFMDGYRANLQFVGTRVRRLAETVATTDQPLAATWFLRFAEEIDRELTDTAHLAI